MNFKEIVVAERDQRHYCNCGRCGHYQYADNNQYSANKDNVPVSPVVCNKCGYKFEAVHPDHAAAYLEMKVRNQS